MTSGRNNIAIVLRVHKRYIYQKKENDIYRGRTRWMGDGMELWRKVAWKVTSRRTREIAEEALRESDFAEAFRSLGVDGDYDTAGAALRAALSVKATELLERAAKVARKGGMKMGAAAVVIAAQQ